MIGDVREVDITSEMQAAYLDYAMSVIVARALPDVRDGLKPVQRRILYAMHDMGLLNSRPYKKSARIVGEVLGKYHPHNDSSVYDAMVRMAQEFSLRYPLVDGQGNFGSIDGDNAAAMRYTEARLAAISDLVLTDIEKDTVDWRDNFDTTLKEPGILPAALPNLLVNGANGIAVGMATNIPPHNLAEVVDAAVHLIDNFRKIDDISVNDLLQFINGPDFPTGGILYRYRQASKGEEEIDAISQAYATGRGRLILQAKAHFEEMSRNRRRIVVTELPYQTNKTNLLERIALLVRDGKIDGITDLRDESDRTGMRIVIELTRNVEPKTTLARLFRLTPMQQTFGLSLLALAKGEPRILNLKRILVLFIEHRQEIIRRRSEFDLARARARSHIVEGMLKALEIMDEVIQTIRRSQRVDTARSNLMRNFGFTQVQAQAILDMPLRRLTALERKQLQDEHKALRQRIAYLEALLADEAKILGVVREEMLALRQQHGDGRRTQIVERTQGTLTATDLLPDRRVWVALGANGELRRQDFDGISRAGLRKAARNAAVALLTANTRDQLFVLAADGRCQRLGVHELPQDRRRHLADLTDFSRRDAIAALLALPNAAPEGFLFLATRQGTVKRIALSEFIQATAANGKIMSVAAKDRLVRAFVTPGNDEVVLVTRQGYSIRFLEEVVRARGPATRGIAGINLKQDDEVIAALPVLPGAELLTVTSAGFAKRTLLSEFGLQGRGGGGLIAHRISERSGELVGAAMLTPAQAFATFVTKRGVAKPLQFDDIPSRGRNTPGAKAVDLSRSDAVTSVQVVSPLLLAMDGPPLPPAPQPNGSEVGAGAQRATKVSANTAKREDTADDGPREAVASSVKKKRTTKAAAARAGNGDASAQDKTPGRASATSRKEKTGRSGRSRPAAPKPSRQPDEQKSAPKAGGRRRPDKAKETAPAAPERSTNARSTAEKATSGTAVSAKSAQRGTTSANQLVQGQLIEEKTAGQKEASARSDAPSTPKRQEKMDRVTSVRRSQKKRSK